MLEVSFDVMQSAALAALVAMVGRGIVKRVKFFQTYCIPGVIVAGLIVSFILGILRSAGVLSVHFEVTVLKEWFMDIFFTGVGLTASWALIKKGGKVCIGITITTIGLILGQDILGVVLATDDLKKVHARLQTLHGLGLGSLSLMGGVGTSSAIAPSYEALGAENAVVLAVMCATFGMVFASLCGGPVARALITDPQIILADEPTGALDSRASDHLLDLFGQVNAAGQTILMVTHSVKAASHARRVLFLRDGEVYHQLYRGEESQEAMFARISDTLTVLAQGGEVHA